MNKNAKKISMGVLAGVALIATPLVTVVSCGSSESEESWKNSKTIVITVDGAQKEMYAAAIAKFNKSEFGKKGYKIKQVNKNVFGAMDMVKSVGFTDENVGDLLYMPQDRMTDMLQQKALRPWSKEEAAKMFKAVGASNGEKQEAREFESHAFSGSKNDVMFGFPHNKEGIAIATNKDVKLAKKEIDKEGILGLQNKAKGLFRLQDMWYGSAMMATPSGSGQILTDHILYGDQSSWSSAFMKTDPNHSAAKSVTDTMADMWYEPLAKAYISGASESLIGKDWYNSKIPSDALKNFFQDNMGPVNNMLIDEVTKGHLDYIYAGTWEAQNLSARGIKTYINPSIKIAGTTDAKNKVRFLQASGTWSFGINARNNGADQERIDAIYKLLECIYSAESFTKYFQQDTKVPWFKGLQRKVKKNVQKENEPKIKATAELYDKLVASGAITPAKPLTDKTEKIEALSAWLKTTTFEYDNLKNIAVDSEWKGNIAGSTISPVYPKSAPKTLDIYKATTKEYADATGLVDTVAKLLGYTDAAALKTASGTDEWKVSSAALKANSITSAVAEGKNAAHIRKLAKVWSGFNGDNVDEKKAVAAKFSISPTTKTVSEFVKAVADAKAKFNAYVKEQAKLAGKFSNDFAKSGKITDSKKLEALTRGYLNNIWNDNLRDAQYQFVSNNVIKNITFKVGSSKESMIDIVKESNKASKTLAISEVYNVISSTASDDRGEFQTQKGRFDRMNPQFAAAWGLWNQNTFGNKQFLKKAISKAVSVGKTHDKAQEEFKKLIEEHLSEQFEKKVIALRKAKAQGFVKI